LTLSDVIDPNAIPIPDVHPEDLDTAARALKTDGTNIAQTGHDIDSDWQGLKQFYQAPEAASLFAKTKPVASAGDAVKTPTQTVGDALITFAETAKKLKQDLNGLKSKAVAFRKKIDGDDDWREDEDKVKEHNSLNNDILAKLVAYQAAERDCANKITSLFGGTHFIGGDPTQKNQKPGKGEQIYGLSRSINDIETPWAKPQKYDAPWYEDVWNGIKDFGVGIVQDVASLVGLYGADGWGWQGWGGLLDNWESLAGGIVGLVGLYGPDGWGWQGLGNLGNNWLNLVNAFVPYREWDGGNGAGYVITQSILNIGSCFVGAGVVKGVLKAAKAGRGLEALEGASAASKVSVLGRAFMDGFKSAFKLPSISDLKTSLNNLKLKVSDLTKIGKDLDEAKNFDTPTPDLPENEPIHVGGDDGTGSHGGTDHGGTDHGGNDHGGNDHGGNDHGGNDTGGGGKETEGGGKDTDTGGEDHGGSDHGGNDTGGGGKDTDTGGKETEGGGKDTDTSGEDHGGSDHGGTDHGGKDHGDTDQGTGTEGGDKDTGTGGDHGHENTQDGGTDSKGHHGTNDPNTPDPETAKKLAKADALENDLRHGGLSDEQIDRLRGDLPRDSRQWLRIASALDQKFGGKVPGGKVQDLMQPKAIDFALDGGRVTNPETFAHRYEYFKARFDVLKAQIKAQVTAGTLKLGSKSPLQEAIEQFDRIDLKAQLQSDLDRVHEVRPHPASVDPNLPEGDLENAIRAKAGDIDMGSDTSAAYHAIKHGKELVPDEVTGDPIRDYFNSAERTIHDGDVVDRKQVPGGGEELIFRREVLDGAGKPRLMEAIVLERPDGRLILKTYGTAKAKLK
jgi:hypothetical protein